jgi:hypothetical protein
LCSADVDRGGRGGGDGERDDRPAEGERARRGRRVRRVMRGSGVEVAGREPGILEGVTAKEQLLREAPSWNETQAAAALRVVHGSVDRDLEALLEEEGDEILAEMDAREDEAARRRSKA